MGNIFNKIRDTIIDTYQRGKQFFFPAKEGEDTTTMHNPIVNIPNVVHILQRSHSF